MLSLTYPCCRSGQHACLPTPALSMYNQRLPVTAGDVRFHDINDVITSHEGLLVYLPGKPPVGRRGVFLNLRATGSTFIYQATHGRLETLAEIFQVVFVKFGTDSFIVSPQYRELVTILIRQSLTHFRPQSFQPVGGFVIQPWSGAVVAVRVWRK